MLQLVSTTDHLYVSLLKFVSHIVTTNVF